QRVADGAGDVPDGRQRVGGVDDLGPQGELLEPEALAFVNEQRRRPLVDLQHEPRSGHPVPLASPSRLAGRTRPLPFPAGRRRTRGREPPATWSARTRPRPCPRAAPRPRGPWPRRTSIAAPLR